MRCPRCGEYDVITVHHDHLEDESDCLEDGPCHSYCRNCDNGICGREDC